MSGEARKRCPNCAWAIGLADALQLPQEESWILTVIAEHVGPDLHFHATLPELSRLTRIKPVTLSKHLRSLAKREVGIRSERSREGYHYHLLRPSDALSKPTRPSMPYDVAEDPIGPGPANFASPDVQNLHIPTIGTDPEPAKSAIPDAQNLHIPIMTPLEESLEEKRPPLKGGDARANAHAPPTTVETNVVALDSSTEIVAAWNAVAEQRGLPKVVAMPKRRLRALTLRIREVGVDGMMQAIANVSVSAFCGGDNDRGWCADFDFLLQSTSLVRVLEGRYADRAKKGLRDSGMTSLRKRWNLPTMRVDIDPEPDDARRIAP